MTNERSMLQQALNVVSGQQAELQREIDAFSRFHDAVSQTFPAETGDTGLNPTARLTDKYKETVLAASDDIADTDPCT